VHTPYPHLPHSKLKYPPKWVNTPRGPGTAPFSLHKLGFGVPGPGGPSKMGLKTPRGPGTPLSILKTLNLGSRAPGVHRPSWCTPRDTGTHSRVPVYRAHSFPRFPFWPGPECAPLFKWCTFRAPSAVPVVHSHVPPSSFPRPRVIGALSPTVLSPSPLSTSQAALLLFALFG
jgi:hypothetical protein